MFVTGIVITFLGTFALLKNRKSLASLSFFIQSLSLSVWLLGITAVYLSRDAKTAEFWVRFFWSGVVFIGSSFYFFVNAFIGEAARRKRQIVANLVLSFLFLGFVHFSNHLIQGTNHYYYGYYAKAGWMIYP